MRSAGAGSSKHQARGAVAGGSWQQTSGAVAGGSWQQARGAVAAGSRRQTRSAVAEGSKQGTTTEGRDSNIEDDGTNSRRAKGAVSSRRSERSAGRVPAEADGGTEAGGDSSRGIDGASSCSALGWAAALGGSIMGAARGCNQCKGVVASEGCSQWEPALSVADGLLEPLDCQVHVNDKSKFWVSPSCGYAHAPVASVARGRYSCSAERMTTWDAGGGGTGGADSSGAYGGASCYLHRGAAAAEPARPITITVCAGRKGGGSGGGTGLSGVRLGRELAEWRNQGSELAEWRRKTRELAESAARCRTVKSGCRTEKSGCRIVPAHAMHISTYWELWASPERGCNPVEVRLCIVSLVSDSQCSLLLCFSRRLLQRMSQETVSDMGQWVVER